MCYLIIKVSSFNELEKADNKKIQEININQKEFDRTQQR